MRQRNAAIAAACLGIIGFANISRGQVVINEFQYDDTGVADDREFVELYNAGSTPVTIGGWTLGGRDATTINTSTTITAGTVLNPGAFYVVGNAGTLNVNQTAAAGFLENDIESIEIRDLAGALVDALIYESNKGMTGNLAGSDLPAQVGPGVFGNNQGVDIGTTPPLNATVSVGRYFDGRDANNNGRDFIMRPSTPGTSNHGAGLMLTYVPPNPSGQTVGSDVPGLTGSFVNARYINPTVADANNPNAIADAPLTPGRAIIAWDNSGGGNGVTSNQVFATKQSGYNIAAYFDTTDMPQNTNATGVQFTGSEITIYGIGGGDPLTNLTDLTGALGLGAVALPAAESANGFTGYAWIYERTALSGATAPTEKLHLVNANDGGDSDVDGNTPLDWVILQTVDLSTIASGWFDLGINIDALGNGTATFGNQTFVFTADAGFVGGAFNVGYRENLQLGADTTPDALMRPPTFTVVPEPTSIALLGLGGLGLLARRRRMA